jgi:hypothetical protein
MELETVATNEIKILDVHLLKLNRLLDSSMKNGSGNIVLQAYIVKEILRNNSHSVFDVLIHNQSSAYAIYKLLCLIESNTLNETTLLFTYSLKMIIQEMWERDKTWSFSAF